MAQKRRNKDQKMKKRLFEILEKASHDDIISKIMDLFITLLIVSNVMPWFLKPWRIFITDIMITSSLLKSFPSWPSHLNMSPVSGSVRSIKNTDILSWGRLRFMLTPMALIDLIAIVPFYFVFMHFDSRFLRSVRLFRLLRLLKLGRYSESFKILGNVLRSKKEELTINVFSYVFFWSWLQASCTTLNMKHNPKHFPVSLQLCGGAL